VGLALARHSAGPDSSWAFRDVEKHTDYEDQLRLLFQSMAKLAVMSRTGLMGVMTEAEHCSLNQGFQNDEKYAGKAWFSENDLPSWWTGIVGIFCQRLRSVQSPHTPRSKRRAFAKFFRGLAWFAAVVAWVSMVDVSRSCFAVVVLLYVWLRA